MKKVKTEAHMGEFGIYLFCFQQFITFLYITVCCLNVAAYKTSTAGTYSVAEAAYVTSLWVEVGVSVGCAIASNIFWGVIILANRITRSHIAYNSQFTEASAEQSGADSPRVGNHSLAGVVSSEQYSGARYNVHGDGAVVARIGDRPMTWRNEAEFKAWVDSHPAPNQ